jgi:haloalkane dehalogenase
LQVPVTAEVLAAYRATYGDRASRRPLLQWAREIPLAGEPADVAERMAAAAEHLRSSSVPALLIHGQPGVLMTPAVVDWCRRHVSPLTVVDVGGPAGHFLPEDRPAAVTDAIMDWIAALP